jgi:Cell wall-active antibiotics response 4TMS YvqF/Domain of unknown function (DUF1707)
VYAAAVATPAAPSRETRLALSRAQETRERVIGDLQEHFAHDALDVDEFERRVTLAHTSESQEAILALLDDLPALAGAPGRAPKTALVPADEVRPSQTLRAIMSSTERRGPWVVPRKIRVLATMSSTVLDFRDARLPAGTVEIDVRAIMSSAEIIVPPGLAVETEGSAIMGTFEHVDRAPAHPDPEAPLLRVRGLAIMGSVEIKMRLPGETERDAHRRLKQERRGRKALPGR